MKEEEEEENKKWVTKAAVSKIESKRSTDYCCLNSYFISVHYTRNTRKYNYNIWIRRIVTLNRTHLW